MTDSTPWLTADLPGTGGRIREKIEDFVVEELPLYEPSGAGEHLFVTVRKSGVSTHEAVRRLARALGCPPGAIGYAGLKDARALAIQRFSVAGVDEAVLARTQLPGLEIVEARRHRNKLRPGHLRGNRFVIRIRGGGPEAEPRARAVLDRLVERGAPNPFGSQRFGSKGDGDRTGRALVKGDAEGAVRSLLGPGPEPEADPRLVEARRRYVEGDLKGALAAFPPAYRAERAVLAELVRGRTAARALRRIPRPVERLLVSAYQSRLFNRLLAERMPDLGALQPGDLAWLHDRGAVFLVRDAAVEQPRADRQEISPSAPLFGRKVTLAEGEPGERERRLLVAEELELEDFGRPPARFSGERRPLRVPLLEARVRPDGEDAIVLAFALPRGSFATVVLREVMKGPERETPESE